MLIPLLSRNPELFTALHNIGEHGPSKEDHVLPAGRILDPDLEFLEAAEAEINEYGCAYADERRN